MDIKQTIAEAAANLGWGEYGNAVKALVDKYAVHNVADSSSPAGPNTASFRAQLSGEIRYNPAQSYYEGYNNTFHRVAHHAALIGSKYPKDKAEEFKKELAAIPHPAFVNDTAGTLHKVERVSEYGTAFSTEGLRITPVK